MRLVIFDCDGVLVDSEPISVRHDVELFAELGLPMSEAEVIDRFVGRSTEVIARGDRGPARPPPPRGGARAGRAAPAGRLGR